MGDIMNDSSIYNTTTGSEGYETAKEDQSSVQYYSILEQDDTLQNISGISLDNCSTTPTRCDPEPNADIDQEHLMLSGKDHLDFDMLQHTVVHDSVQDGVEDTVELSAIQNLQDAMSPTIQPQTAGQIVETTEGRMILYKLEGSDELYAIPVDTEELTQDNEADNQLLPDGIDRSENEENEEVLIQYSFGSAAVNKSDDDINDISVKNILSEDLQVSCSNSDYEETTIEDVTSNYAYVKKQKEETHESISDSNLEDADKLNGCQNVSGTESVEQEEYLDEEYLEYETGDGEPVTGDSDIIYNSHLSETDSLSDDHDVCQGVIVVEPVETERFLKKDERKYYIQKNSSNIMNLQDNKKSPIESMDSLDLINSTSKPSAKAYSKHLSDNNSSFSKKQISTVVSGMTLTKTPGKVCNTLESFKQYYTNSTKKQLIPKAIQRTLKPPTMDLKTHDVTDSSVMKIAENISPVKIKPRNRKQVLTVVDRPDAEIIFEPILHAPEDQGKEKTKRGRKPKQSEGSLVSKSSESEVEIIPEKPKRKYTKSIKTQESTIVSPLRFSKRLSKKSKDIKTCRIKSCNCDLEHTSWASGDSGTDDSHLAEKSDSSVASDEWPMDNRTKKWVNKQQQKNDEEKLNSSKSEDNIINDEEENMKEVSSIISLVKYDDNHSPLENKFEEKVSAAVLEELKECSFLLNRNADMTWLDKCGNTDDSEDFNGFYPQCSLITTSQNDTEEILTAESISKLRSIDLDIRKTSTSVLARKENVETKNDVNSYDTNKYKYSTKRLSSVKKKIIINKQKRSANQESVVVPPKKSKINDIPPKATKGIKPESFVCRICDKHFRQYTHLITHQNMHKKVGFVKCKHCSREFPFQSGLNAHIKKCPKGNKIETRKVDTEQTEEKSDAILSNSFEGIPFKNIASKLTFRIPNTKQSNVKLVASPFKSKRTMLVRKALGFSKYKCEKCSTQLTSAMGLASHMRLHDMKKTPQKLKTARSISRPSMIPMKTSRLSTAAATLGTTKRKTLGATKHEKSFLTVEHKELQENDRKRDLQGLRYISRNKKLSTPSNYNKKTETKGSALKSMISKKFKCAECSLVFKTQPEMARHRSSHSATKTFKCIECNKAFGSRALLNEHAGIHRIRKTSGKTNEATIKPKTPGSTTKRKPHGGVMLNSTLHKKLEELKNINK